MPKFVILKYSEVIICLMYSSTRPHPLQMIHHSWPVPISLTFRNLISHDLSLIPFPLPSNHPYNGPFTNAFVIYSALPSEKIVTSTSDIYSRTALLPIILPRVSPGATHILPLQGNYQIEYHQSNTPTVVHSYSHTLVHSYRRLITAPLPFSVLRFPFSMPYALCPMPFAN
jgi:hypothetical protein